MRSRKQLNAEYTKFIKHLVDEPGNVDRERNHIFADRALCELLVELGFRDVVIEYKKLGLAKLITIDNLHAIANYINGDQP